MANKSFEYKLSVTIMALLVLSLLLEYAGWSILSKSDADVSFPGFSSAEVLKSALVNSVGAMLFGLLTFGFCCVFRKLRTEWRRYMFTSFWIGIGVFYLYMFILVIIGLVAV